MIDVKRLSLQTWLNKLTVEYSENIFRKGFEAFQSE